MGLMLTGSPSIYFKLNADANPGEKPSIKLFLFVDDQFYLWTQYFVFQIKRLDFIFFSTSNYPNANHFRLFNYIIDTFFTYLIYIPRILRKFSSHSMESFKSQKKWKKESSLSIF